MNLIISQVTVDSELLLTSAWLRPPQIFAGRQSPFLSNAAHWPTDFARALVALPIPSYHDSDVLLRLHRA